MTAEEEKRFEELKNQLLLATDEYKKFVSELSSDDYISSESYSECIAIRSRMIHKELAWIEYRKNFRKYKT